ncbi:MAG: lipopolysaccharide modification acyltransferase [Cytophagaceae bacterium]|nr:lipopolysaccharide modification acyltransferase [Cytophagaceae bacterium]
MLRAIAVILVMFRHSNLENSPIQEFGWLGVDLFFVLSGFLISDILFQEYKTYGQPNLKRFFRRRTFKIIIPLYAFLVIELLMNVIHHDVTPPWPRIASEFLYLQNYFPGIWIHTWSLAVEARFYLIFPIILVLVIKKNLLEKRGLIIGSIVSLFILIFLMRLYVSYPHREESFYVFPQADLRIDGILAGILLSYLYNFTSLFAGWRQNKWTILMISLLLIVPGFYFKGGSFFMNTIGLTVLNAGFALLVLFTLCIESVIEKQSFSYLKIPTYVVCQIGIQSYSIYLWHITTSEFIYSHFNFSAACMVSIAFISSLFFGSLMYYLIERPSLRLRKFIFKES